MDDIGQSIAEYNRHCALCSENRDVFHKSQLVIWMERFQLSWAYLTTDAF